MMRQYSLAHLTAIDLPPPDLIRIAGRAGYDAVGLRLQRVTADTPGYPLWQDPAMLQATKSALADTGIGVFDIEFIQLHPESDIAALEPLLECGAGLGAKWLITAPYDPDLARLADRFAALCDRAAPLGIGVVMEFFPWTVLPSAADAHALVRAAGRPNSGVLVDVLHFARGPSTTAQLDAIPPDRLPYMHLCDAPAGTNFTREQLLHTARAERLPPGEGAIPIVDIMAHLPPGIPVGLEVPMPRLLAEHGPEAAMRRLREAAIRLLDG